MPGTEVCEPRVPAGEASRWRVAGWLLAVLAAGGAATYDPFGFATAGPLRWTVITVALLAGAAGLAGRTVAIDRPAVTAWLLLLGWLLVATVTALDPLHAWIGTPDRRMGWLAWALLALAFLCGQALDGERETRLVLRAVAIGAAVLGLGALAELAGALPGAVAFAGGRLGGLYGQPAYLGAAAALLALAAAGLAADRGEARSWRRVAAAGAVLGGIALVASQTRGAWVGAACGLAVLLPRLAREARRRRLAAAAVGAGLVAVALATPIGARVLSIADPGAAGRLDEWRVAAAAVAERPLLGAGPEGYRIAFTEAVDAGYARAHGRDVLTDRAHNSALDAGASGGLPAMAAYVVLAWLVLAAGWRARRAAPWLAGTGAGVVAYVVQQQFLFPLAEVDPTFWLLAGLVMARTRRAPRRTTAGKVRVPAAAGAVLAALAVTALAAGGLDVAADRELRQAAGTTGTFDHAVAVAHADRATSLRPDSLRAWFVAARVAARGEAITDVDAALDRIEAGLDRGPLDPALRAEHAALLLERARRSRLPADATRATDALERLVADDPHHPGHRLRLATALLLAGDDTAAARQVDIAEDLAPTGLRTSRSCHAC